MVSQKKEHTTPATHTKVNRLVYFVDFIIFLKRLTSLYIFMIFMSFERFSYFHNVLNISFGKQRLRQSIDEFLNRLSYIFLDLHKFHKISTCFRSTVPSVLDCRDRHMTPGARAPPDHRMVDYPILSAACVSASVSMSYFPAVEPGNTPMHHPKFECHGLAAIHTCR